MKRFESKVSIGADGCWTWLGAKSPQGHGVFRYRGRNIPAHHYSFGVLAGENIPAGCRVLHSCSNPSCVKPAHLFLGTPENILSFKSRASNGGCVEWTGHKVSGGYGVMGLHGRRTVLVHRVAYALKYGPIPDGMFVLHRCDNRLCINPDHLFIGTKGDNNADRDSKGRTARGEVVARSKRGSSNPHSRLTEELVIAIRAMAARGMKQSEIAKAMKIDQGHVSAIIHRKKWSHLL
jgi:hypothetical protein